MGAHYPSRPTSTLRIPRPRFKSPVPQQDPTGPPVSIRRGRVLAERCRPTYGSGEEAELQVPETPAEQTSRWRAYSIFAGGAKHLDGVLEATVAPTLLDALHQVPLERWGFIRWVDGRGPHLRLALCATTAWGPGAAGGAALRAGLPAAQGAPVREPVLTPPKSLSGPAPVGVEIQPFEPAAVGFDFHACESGAAISTPNASTANRGVSQANLGSCGVL